MGRWWPAGVPLRVLQPVGGQLVRPLEYYNPPQASHLPDWNQTSPFHPPYQHLKATIPKNVRKLFTFIIHLAKKGPRDEVVIMICFHERPRLVIWSGLVATFHSSSNPDRIFYPKQLRIGFFIQNGLVRKFYPTGFLENYVG